MTNDWVDAKGLVQKNLKIILMNYKRERRLSNTQMAWKYGLNIRTMSHFLGGRRNLSPSKIEIVCLKLGITPESLLPSNNGLWRAKLLKQFDMAERAQKDLNVAIDGIRTLLQSSILEEPIDEESPPDEVVTEG